MRISTVAGIIVAATLSAGQPLGAFAADKLHVAQADFGTRMGPPRSPDVVIEEPRPPRGAIETEGRGEPQKCRSPKVSEWRDNARVIRPEQACD